MSTLVSLSELSFARLRRPATLPFAFLRRVFIGGRRATSPGFLILHRMLIFVALHFNHLQCGRPLSLPHHLSRRNLLHIIILIRFPRQVRHCLRQPRTLMCNLPPWRKCPRSHIPFKEFRQIRLTTLDLSHSTSG